ncbi:MAG: tRNA (5-methylaminomethyl-2-thiouridine)(34)-methyltransferase MnmD [Bacteroidia bacterium]
MPHSANIALRQTADGSSTLFSQRYNSFYHSTHGALQESLHVFIENGLNRFQNHNAIQILEIGIGTGLNALLTMEWCNRHNIKAVYIGYETQPLDEELYAYLHFNESLNPWIEPFHKANWYTQVPLGPFFTFEKRMAPWPDAQNKDRFDLVYFDAFGPDAQPEMWESQVLSACVEAMSQGAVWVTYSSKGAVRRNLETFGLKMEKLAGPPHKRHMLRGIKQ